jgi:rare lipoprotein A
MKMFLLFMALTLACAHSPAAGDSQHGMASWYGADHHGKRTASGEPFNMNDFTAAHRSLPMNSVVKVTSLSTGQSVNVRINDRGPFSRGRLIDLSYAAAKKIGMVQKGMDQVEIEVLSLP